MSPHSTYDTLRHLADSWGLVAMGLVFLVRNRRSDDL
jgi:cytochrome c oxidase cbb3-type subunit IV